MNDKQESNTTQAVIDNLEYQNNNLMLLVEALRIAVIRLTEDMQQDDLQRFMESCVDEAYDVFGLKE